MSLLPGIRELVIQNMNNTVSVFTEISTNEQKLKKFVDKWGYDGDDIYGFLHGYLAGSISETAHLTARLTLNRSLSDEEITELYEFINEKMIEVREIISKLRNA